MTAVQDIDQARAATPTAGIQEAIDSLPPAGGIVRLAAGVYPLRRSIFLRSGVTLIGAGAATVLRPVQPHLTRLTATMPPGGATAQLADALPLRVGDQVLIAEPYVPGCGRHFGYFARYLAVTELDGRTVRGATLYGKDEYDYRVEHDAYALSVFPALFIRDAHDVTARELAIDGGASEALTLAGVRLTDFITAAVLIDQAPRCRVRDLTITRWPSDGVCAGGPYSDCLVTGCAVEHCQGIGLHTGGGIQSAQWLHNISRHNHSGFLFCQGNRNVLCAHNLVSHNRKSGIWGLDNSDRFNVITGNICRNNSQSKPGAFAGIHLRRHRDNLVRDNLCIDDQETPTQLRGVDAADHAGANQIVV